MKKNIKDLSINEINKLTFPIEVYNEVITPKSKLLRVLLLEKDDLLEWRNNIIVWDSIPQKPSKNKTKNKNKIEGRVYIKTNKNEKEVH